jgi:hypothetical protein
VSDFYILKDGKPVKVADVLEWARYFDLADRHVGLTEAEPLRVSTVFLGVDHNFTGKGPPLLFESMVFDADGEVDCERYATREEAAAGHIRLVAKWIKPPEAAGETL